MEDKDFNESVEEIVNVFMRVVSSHGPEELFNLSMAVFMNVLAIIPYPIMKVSQDGSDFSNKYKELVMEMMPKFTVALRGHALELMRELVNKSIDMGLVKDGEFDFIGQHYPVISQPPTQSSN